MLKHDLAILIGKHILDSIDKIIEDKKDFGSHIKIPFKCTNHSNEPDWIHSIQIDMPRYVKWEYVNGERVFKTVTMSEYYKWKK